MITRHKHPISGLAIADDAVPVRGAIVRPRERLNIFVPAGSGLPESGLDRADACCGGSNHGAVLGAEVIVVVWRTLAEQLKQD